MHIYHFVMSINNTTIVDTIIKEVRDAPKMLQKTFAKVLILEAGLQ